MLRDWGLDRDRSDRAAERINAPLSRAFSRPIDLKFAMIGDDNQGDLTAFGAIAVDNPGRIRAISFARSAKP